MQPAVTKLRVSAQHLTPQHAVSTQLTSAQLGVGRWADAAQPAGHFMHTAGLELYSCRIHPAHVYVVTGEPTDLA